MREVDNPVTPPPVAPAEMDAHTFQFKQFAVLQDRCAMKVGTDGVLLGAWADVSGVRNALDIGAGTGLIAIMLAQRAPQAVIHAAEIDAQTCEQARENMRATPWAARLEIFHSSIQRFVAENPARRYDLIVSNPPFFTGGVLSEYHRRNQVRHTVKLPHGDLLSAVRTLLRQEGRFAVILPLLEGLRFQELARLYHLYCTRLTEVKTTPAKPVSRLLLRFERKDRPQQRDELVIQEEKSNEWTAAYRQLTRDFYLKA
jgi:tRNA1Val (adenine37-N6)-methyltransferase